MTRHAAVLVAVVLASLSSAHPARAAEAAAEARVRELEALVAELSRRVTELERRDAAAPVASAEAAAAPTEAPAAQADEREPKLTPRWDDRLRFRSKDGQVDVELGGRLEQDVAFFSAERDLEREVGEMSDGTELRRLRLSISGRLWKRVGFELENDFAQDGTAELKDAFVEVEDLGLVGKLRVGHFREPFSLEEMSPERHEPFMERSLASALAPGRNAGLRLSNDALDGRLTWAAGAFRETDRVGRSDKGSEGWNVTARVTGLPWRASATRLVHLGVSHSWRHPDASRLRLVAQPESHLAPSFLDTGLVPLGGDVELLGVEAALVHGRTSFQSEWTRLRAESLLGTSLDFWGWYAEGSVFLTGESRRYREPEGRFGLITPRRPVFGGRGGPGAVELALRYSRADFNEAFVRGGDLQDWTLGVNWYLDRNLQLSWNWVRADLEGFPDADALQLRVKLAF